MRKTKKGFKENSNRKQQKDELDIEEGSVEEWEKGRGEGKDQNLFGDMLSFRCHVRHISI